MIAQLRGRVAARSRDTVVVDVHGVGYLVHVPASMADRVPARGEEVELHTSLQVREDSMTLYGFPDRSARELFELLLTASGVGPKLALAALSTHPAGALRAAIADGDVDTLTLIPGIGKKSAQRLVLELREKLGGDGDALLDDAGGYGGGAGRPVLSEVRDALLALGYTPGEAHDAMSGLDADGDGDVGALVKTALKRLGRGSRATVGTRP